MWSVSSTECSRTPDTPNGRSRSYAPGRRFDCPGCISRSFRWCRCFPRMFSAALIFFADSNLVLSVNAESAHSIPCDPSRLSHAEFSERQSSPNFFQPMHRRFRMEMIPQRVLGCYWNELSAPSINPVAMHPYHIMKIG